MVVIQSTIQWYLWVDVYPSTKCNVILLAILSVKMSMSTTHCLETSPIFSGCSGWYPWAEAIASHLSTQGSLPSLMLGECTIPSSSCGVVLLSLPLGVGLTGVGLVHLSCAWQTPTCKGTPASDAMRRSQLWCGHVNFHAGLSLHMRGCLLQSDALPHELVLPSVLDLPLPLKGICLTLGWRSARFQSYGTYFPVVVLLLSLSLCHRLGLGLLKSGPQMVSNSGYNIH